MRTLRNTLSSLTLALLISSAFAFAKEAPTEKRAEITDAYIQSKIGPNVSKAFADLTAQKADGEEAGLRVILNLYPLDGESANRALDTAQGLEAHRSDVTAAQNRLIADLGARDLLANSDTRGRGDRVQVEMLLDLQYAMAVTIPNEKMAETLAANPNIASIVVDNLNELFTVQGRAVTGSDTVASSGYTGNGVGVAVVDSNFDLLHPELGGSTSLPNGVVYGGYNYSSNNSQIHSQNFNDCYHGTGTASIVRRYATDVDLYALTVFPNAYDSVIANSINWCITNKNGVNGGAPIKVISMSLGGGQYSSTCNSGVIHTASGTALSNGILVLAATGNDGWTSSISSPACSSNVISIGSTWDENGAAYSPFYPAYCSDSNRQVDERACYSNKSGVMDLYAPSEEVICAQCGGGTWALGGTSSATPAAAGMIAQLLDRDNSYSGNKSSTLTLLQGTGVTVIGDTGKRRIDIEAAINSLGGGTPAPTVSLTASPASISSGGTSTLSWTTTNASSVSINQGVGSVSTSGSVNVSPTSTTTYTITATGAGGTSTDTATVTVTTGGSGLQNGVGQSVSVATGATQTYTISLPANVTSMTVSMTGSGDMDLYVKNSPVNWPSEQGSHNTSTFKAPYIGGSSESVTFTSPASGTWHVLIHGYSGGSGTVTASWTVSSGTAQWNYESIVEQTPHNYGNNQVYEFTYDRPGASQVAVHFVTLNTEANYDYLYVYDENDNLVFQESGNLISSGSGSAFGRTDGWCVVSGSKMRVRLVTDYSVTRYGYRTDQMANYQ